MLLLATTDAAKYGILIVKVKDGKKNLGGVSVKIGGVCKGRTNSEGELHIPTVTPGSVTIKACKETSMGAYSGSTTIKVVGGKTNTANIGAKYKQNSRCAGGSC
jgi:hypothetical protein